MEEGPISVLTSVDGMGRLLICAQRERWYMCWLFKTCKNIYKITDFHESVAFESIDFESGIMICQHHTNVINWKNSSETGVSEGIAKRYKHGHHVKRGKKGVVFRIHM